MKIKSNLTVLYMLFYFILSFVLLSLTQGLSLSIYIFINTTLFIKVPVCTGTLTGTFMIFDCNNNLDV